MQIDISRHAIKRAKKRFSLNAKALARMAQKAVQDGTKNISHDNHSTSYTYSHFNFLFSVKEDKLVLMTVVDLQKKADFKEKNSHSIFRKGKKTDDTFFAKDLF